MSRRVPIFLSCVYFRTISISRQESVECLECGENETEREDMETYSDNFLINISNHKTIFCEVCQKYFPAAVSWWCEIWMVMLFMKTSKLIFIMCVSVKYFIRSWRVLMLYLYIIHSLDNLSYHRNTIYGAEVLVPNNITSRQASSLATKT